MDLRKNEREKKQAEIGKECVPDVLFLFWWNKGEAKEIVLHLQNKHVSHVEIEEKKFWVKLLLPGG